MCTVFATFLIIFMVPDEMWHIFKVFDLNVSDSVMAVPYSIAGASGATQGLGVGITSYSELYDLLTAQPDWLDTYDVERDMSTYLPHLYFLASIVVKICSLFAVTPAFAIIAARLVNAVVYIVFGYIILKKLPIGKTLACVYMLNPLLLQQEASCSADAICNIAVLGFVAYFLWLYFSETISRKDIVLLVVLFVVAAASKIIYALLVYILLLLVPRLKSKRARVAIYAGSATFTVLCVIAVVAIGPSLMLSGTSYASTIDLIVHPRFGLTVMAQTIYTYGPGVMAQFFSSTLGALNIPVWTPCIWILMVIMTLAAFCNLGETRSFGSKTKLVIVVVCVVTTFALISLFRSWAIEVDGVYNAITGVQGRYFYPYALLVMLCYIGSKRQIANENSLLAYACIMLAIYAFDLKAMVSFFM
jgi:uncharacterized membrane protein